MTFQSPEADSFSVYTSVNVQSAPDTI